MSFFYDLNKKLDSIRATPEVTHQQLNERDMSRAAKGIAKYTKPGMEKLSKLGREGASKAKMAATRKEFNQYDNEEVSEDMYNQGGVYKDLEIEPKRPQDAERKMTRGTRPVPKGEFMGTIKGGVWTADPPKPGERGVPAPSGDPEGVKEAVGAIDFDKVLDAIAALYGDDMWNNDAMQDLANELEQAGPTDRELDFIIAKGRLPKRLAGIQFSAGDDVQFGESGAPMTAKQKSFAKLAPPANKITFADKIANAKKEVDEMLGDVAAEAMRSALSPKQKKMAALGGDPKRIDARDLAALRKGDDMDEERSKGTAFDMSTPRAVKPKIGSIERGAKHDIKHTATGRMVTRRTDAQGISVGDDDASDAQAGPRGRGRPKGTKGAIGAKGPSGKSKLMTKEGDQDITDQGEYDQEGDMAKDDIKTIMRHAQALSKVLGDNDNLPEWVQSKLAKIEGMMISIDEYMQNQEDEEEPIAEKAVSKKQQRFMGMVHSAQKGEKPASRAVGKVASTMKPKDTADFAKTKHKGLPEKKKKEVDENSEDGKLTTTQTGPGQTSTSSSTGRISATVDKGKVTVKPAKSGGISYGQGIYDSMNHELELMIAESMSINMSDSTEGGKSLTITATDEDALKLGMLLKNAGLGGGDAHGGDMHSSGEQPCATCGMPDCGCGDVQEAVDENSPDYPTNTEQADNNFGYAGGLNKPKTDVAGDGQSTVPVTAVHTQEEDALRRMMEMAGIKTEDPIDLGPASPEVARMSKDEVNAALRSGMSPEVDLGPASPDIASMSNDEVNAALRSGLSPDISGMDPDSVNAEFGKDDRQYEDSIQRMREMAGIKEWEVKLDQFSPPRTGSYPDQLYGKDKERYDAVQTGSGPESQRVNQYYQNKNAGSYDSGQKYTDERDADYADRLNAVRAARIANNELTPGEWIQKGTNAVRKAFGGQDKPLQPAKTVVDLDGPSNYPSARYVGSDEFNKRKYLDPKADAAYKARQKALFPDDFKEGKGDGNLANNAKPYDKVTQGDVIAGRLGKDEKGGKEKQVEESIFALTNQWKAYKG